MPIQDNFIRVKEFLKDSLQSISTSKDTFKVIEYQPPSVSQYSFINTLWGISQSLQGLFKGTLTGLLSWYEIHTLYQ